MTWPIACTLLIVLAALLLFRRLAGRVSLRQPHISKEQFLHHFAERGSSENVSSIVYEFLLREHPEVLFLQSEENFKRILPFDPDDLEDDIRSLLRLVNPAAPFEQISNDWVGGKIRTIDDLVRLAQWTNEYDASPKRT